MLTGESVPVQVGPGDAMVQATRIGASTQLAQVARLVEDAQNGEAQVQRPGDKVFGTFVPVVILLSLVSVLQRPIKCLRRFRLSSGPPRLPSHPTTCSAHS